MISNGLNFARNSKNVNDFLSRADEQSWLEITSTLKVFLKNNSTNVGLCLIKIVQNFTVENFKMKLQ